jgi:aspartyl-tRNA(Asn)/glutamyl-tRNA(Gln) amidotransferase subunit B
MAEKPKYITTIGLEVHAELATASKMFCDCKNDSSEKRPNTNVCPICLAHPGTLPVINRSAVESVIKVGLALEGKISSVSKFDRKNYFYPDLPKGYQISQYDEPIVSGGTLAGVQITRVHLEEDTGRSQHVKDGTLVDFNRAGVPLMELVTEPVIHDAETALTFAKELQLLLRYLKVSHADMEKGQMRVEANISISSEEGKFGTKVEVKNLNSFRAVEGAIAYELARQEELLEKGEKVVQETRGWDENKKSTFSQRLKESAHDYRYFPEPDLPPLDMAGWDLATLRVEIPELPDMKRVRLAKEYALSMPQAESLALDRESADYFEKSASELLALFEGSGKGGDISYETLFNYFSSDLKGISNEKNAVFSDLKIVPEHFAHLVFLAMENKISSRTAKDMLKKMFETGLDPEEILNTENLGQISDTDELEAVVSKVIEDNPGPAADFKKGKENAIQFLIGKAMANLKGRGNPSVLSEIFREKLK